MHWFLAHWKDLGINAILLAAYGFVMHLLILQKMRLETKKLRLEIDSVKTNHEKLALEIEKLKRERERDDKAERIEILTKRIRQHVKQESTNQFSERKQVVFRAQELSELLHEEVEEVENALSALKAYGEVKYDLHNNKWIFG